MTGRRQRRTRVARRRRRGECPRRVHRRRLGQPRHLHGALRPRASYLRPWLRRSSRLMRGRRGRRPMARERDLVPTTHASTWMLRLLRVGRVVAVALRSSSSSPAPGCTTTPRDRRATSSPSLRWGRPASASGFAVRRPVRAVGGCALGPDALEKHRGGLVAWVLRNQLAAERLREDRAVERAKSSLMLGILITHTIESRNQCDGPRGHLVLLQHGHQRHEYVLE